MVDAGPQPHLADLHAAAAKAGVSGYRKLRREDLVREIDAHGGSVEISEPAGGSGGEGDEVRVEGTVLTPDASEAVETGRRPRERERVAEETEEVSGVLEVTRQRFGFLRLDGVAPGPRDVYVSASQVRRCELRPGDRISGPARDPRRGERHRALVHVDKVNEEEPLATERPGFDDLSPVLPERRMPLDSDRADVLARAVDLLAPIAVGARVLVRAAPRSGRTTLLRGVARAAAGAEAESIVLLVDERPEEATAWREALPDAEFAIATGDMPPAEQVDIAELALERARRRVELGEDVVLICDSLSRIVQAAGDVDLAKRLFGSGRNLAGVGSLTVVATVLSDRDEGEAERAVITTESALVTLDPELAAAGAHPALRISECRISNEEALREPAELEAVRRLRSLLTDLQPSDAASLLRERIEGSATNAELLNTA